MYLLTLIAGAVIAAAPAPHSKPSATCPKVATYQADRSPRPPRAQKLGELPTANAYFAVYRLVDGCMVPVIAGYGYGAKQQPK